jgi:CCR4-NOT transcriptional complex subunit CAF120
MSNLFTSDPNAPGAGGGGSQRSKATLHLYTGSKPKERRIPVLTMYEVKQVFAMYPERPEMINISTLMKVEGLLGDEAAAGGMRSREAWMMIMPEADPGASPSRGMLKWITGKF